MALLQICGPPGRMRACSLPAPVCYTAYRKFNGEREIMVSAPSGWVVDLAQTVAAQAYKYKPKKDSRRSGENSEYSEKGERAVWKKEGSGQGGEDKEKGTKRRRGRGGRRRRTKSRTYARGGVNAP